MHQFMMTTIALTAFGARVATAQADYRGGAPTRNGDQCFKYIGWDDKDGRFGSWVPVRNREQEQSYISVCASISLGRMQREGARCLPIFRSMYA